MQVVNTDQSSISDSVCDFLGRSNPLRYQKTQDVWNTDAFLLASEALLPSSNIRCLPLVSEAFLRECETFLPEAETFLLEAESFLFDSDAFLVCPQGHPCQSSTSYFLANNPDNANDMSPWEGKTFLKPWQELVLH